MATNTKLYVIAVAVRIIKFFQPTSVSVFFDMKEACNPPLIIYVERCG